MTFCGEQSCPCPGAACTCGQVCDRTQGRCVSSQAGFCTADGACAASCNSFICEGNICVPGMRTDGGGGSGYDAGADPVDNPPRPPTGCSCDASGGPLALALGVLLSLARRKTPRQVAVADESQGV